MAYVKEESVVWCHQHGCIHDDTTNPYDIEGDQCDRADHRPVYWRTHVIDIEHESITHKTPHHD